MILEYKIDELEVSPAWIKTLYSLIDELNCKCQTFFEETYNSNYKRFTQTRTIKIRGDSTMLSWLKLRMERYNHYVDKLNGRLDGPSCKPTESDN